MLNNARDVSIGEVTQINTRRYEDASSSNITLQGEVVQSCVFLGADADSLETMPQALRSTLVVWKLTRGTIFITKFRRLRCPVGALVAFDSEHGVLTASPRPGLYSNVVDEALHNSDERCDAPKCYPETRKAVQEDILSWITNGDDDEEPKKMMFVTGPAGTGKTAIAGSIAETCEERGILAGSFFFSSYAGAVERSSKRGVIPTLAYSFVQHEALQNLRHDILSTIEDDPGLFRKQLKDQCKALLLRPFHRLREQLDPASIPKIIILDAIDEVEAAGSRKLERHERRQASETDQIEILMTLLQAAHDSQFPFRILVFSRPERVIQNFFETRANHISRVLHLDAKYDPDSDITLFLRAKLSEIRRRYRLPRSWAKEDVVKRLVENASGQFIYAAVVVRFLESGNASPQVRLNCILGLDVRRNDLKPFAQLDALYQCILSQSPDPALAVEWIYEIDDNPNFSSFFLRHVLEEEMGQADYLLENLTSLLRIPPSEDAKASYELYHKSLLDFLQDPRRSGGELSTSFRSRSLLRRRFGQILLGELFCLLNPMSICACQLTL